MSFPNSMVLQKSIAEHAKEKEASFLVRTCSHCNMEICLSAGDVLYGDGWYHGECWEKVRLLMTRRSNVP